MEQILVIEDDQSVQKMLTRFLEKKGHKVLLAENGAEGLTLFQKHKPPVILMDLKMPVLDGIDFLKQLDTETIKSHAFIVLTGHGGNEEMEECYHLGVQSFLRKPVNMVQLSGVLQRSFDLLHSAEENKRLTARMKSLLHNIPDLVWECDADHQFTYVSDSAEQLLGYLPSELLGTSIEDHLQESSLPEFQFKFRKEQTPSSEKIRGTQLKFINKSGEVVPMQVSAKRLFDTDEHLTGMVGISRDLGALEQVSEGMEKLVQAMTIRINEQLGLTYVDDSVRKFLPSHLQEIEAQPDFSPHVCDSSLLALFQFAFDQKEAVPFPAEIQLEDDSGVERHFTVQFQYDEASECLQGLLHPLNPNDQLAMMNDKIEQQAEDLKSAVVIDPEMQDSILIDSQNLAKEILELIRSLEPYVYQETAQFEPAAFMSFTHNKNLQEYQETLRLLGNKIHGYKGTTGFLIPESKTLCHRMEEITRPLAENSLVLTERLFQLLRQFIFKTQDMLESFQKSTATTFSIDDWLERIEQELSHAEKFLGDHLDQYTELINQRSVDHGEIRHRLNENLSVPQSGYEQLSAQVKKLFYILSEDLPEERLIQAGNLYNKFLETHQQIIKESLDLSRYERLIPSLAQEYGKEGNFVFKDRGVHSDREFWNAIHEIMNHSLKNAVIHGIETPKERVAQGKEAAGTIGVEIKENALNIFVSISDDGRGLDVEKIKEKALEKHIVRVEAIHEMSEEEILHLVFVQGVSTVESLDDNAGRGVGMNAVQEAMRRFQGSCRIESKFGEGTTWHFTFSKSNVSLPSFIVGIGDFLIAIPEDNVETFHEFEAGKISNTEQHPIFKHGQDFIPLVEPQQVFDDLVCVDEDQSKRVMVIKSHDQKKVGLIINRIFHHATLPILPMPEEYRHFPIYTGTTLFRHAPVLVLNANQMVLN